MFYSDLEDLVQVVDNVAGEDLAVLEVQLPEALALLLGDLGLVYQGGLLAAGPLVVLVADPAVRAGREAELLVDGVPLVLVLVLGSPVPGEAEAAGNLVADVVVQLVLVLLVLFLRGLRGGDFHLPDAVDSIVVRVTGDNDAADGLIVGGVLDLSDLGASIVGAAAIGDGFDAVDTAVPAAAGATLAGAGAAGLGLGVGLGVGHAELAVDSLAKDKDLVVVVDVALDQPSASATTSGSSSSSLVGSGSSGGSSSGGGAGRRGRQGSDNGASSSIGEGDHNRGAGGRRRGGSGGGGASGRGRGGGQEGSAFGAITTINSLLPLARGSQDALGEGEQSKLETHLGQDGEERRGGGESRSRLVRTSSGGVCRVCLNRSERKRHALYVCLEKPNGKQWLSLIMVSPPPSEAGWP